ncbi:ethylene-responsive transcription factor-like protein At4g13040 [Pistacia vera]|uniref:ethylene-responsive transcription factor-like protein At4g13040 n=1 Tax=Pistacia vera TaxID=55513 RepID=UPI001263D305|nr:ethylene-responsive transcription factor-like protein At4g13040 [Pistacia vera]
MVSLRRRKLMGLCSGKSSFLAPLPRNTDNGIASETQNAKSVSVHPISSDDASQSPWVRGYDVTYFSVVNQLLSSFNKVPFRSIMVSLRRRKLMGLCSGKSSFLAPLPRNTDNGIASETLNAKSVSVHPISSDDASQSPWFICSRFHNLFLNFYIIRCYFQKTIAKLGPLSSNVSGSSSPEEKPKVQHIEKEQHIQSFSGLPIKRRKRHRRKQIQNQEPCLMRGVCFKNMKWQAAIKVDKKQIHLGIVGSQEVAARLYDRAAFMCGREPNFELSEEEKQELRQFKWDEFLAFTRRSITHKKYKRRLGAGPHKRSESPFENGDWDIKQGVDGFSGSEDGGPDSSA